MRYIALAGLLLLQQTVFAASDDSFRQGVAAFRAGNYAEAAHYFEAAEAAGRNDAALQFNLGSTYFKLGNYIAARTHFNRIVSDPAWRSLALYNLGLIDERQGHATGAEQHYRAAIQAADSERLQHLATARLLALQRDGGADDASPWYGLVSIGGGYDDNVTLTEDPSILGVSNQGASFADVTAALSGYLAGSWQHGMRLDALGFGEFYQDQTDYNIGMGSLGLTWTQLAGHWYFETGGKGEIQTAGQDVLSQAGTFGIRATRALGKSVRLRLRGEGSWINGASSYDYLTGWRARGGTELQFLHDSGQFSIGYVYEYNARDDYTTATEFLSYSPRRNSGFARLEQRLGTHVTAELRAEYLDAKYPDEDQIVGQGGATVIQQRDDKTWTLGARLAWHATDAMDLFADYQYANADSTVEQYSYTQNRALAGIEVQL